MRRSANTLYSSIKVRRHLRVKCTTCGAGPGNPCTSKNGTQLQFPHKARVWRVMDLEALARLRAEPHPVRMSNPQH